MPRPKKIAPPPVDLPAIEPDPIQLEPTELEIVEAEMKEISPRLPGLKANDHEEYEKVYRRYMQLVERRTALLLLNGGA